MLFNSIHFIFFYPAVVLLYFLTPYRWRWALLLAASYYFYMCWNPMYLVLIAGTTLVSWFCGLQLGRASSRQVKNLYMIVTLFACLGTLFLFKYFNFTMDSIAWSSHLLGLNISLPALRLLLPVGISFYTFQTLSYTFDVYRGDIEPEKHLGVFAVYVAFFPQLVAGPIERSTRLMPQFYEKHSFSFERMCDGLKLMLWGFFKKLVIADRLSIYVDQVYNNPGAYNAPVVILATYFFAFQIYCDFSGYSDIAIGSAEVMGYRLMDNFNRPYFSKSIAEFWKRWHISLSTWFKDYLYIPLGGNRCSLFRWLMNLLIVFIVSGLWHGAAWTFVVWGALHGCYLIIEVLISRTKHGVPLRWRHILFPSTHRAVKVFITFHLVLVSWVFFRANSLSDALIIFRSMGDFHLSSWHPSVVFQQYLAKPALGSWELIIAFVSIGVMEGVHLLQRHGQMRHFLNNYPVWVRWPIYYGLMLGILLFGKFGSNAFVYFQF